MGWQGGSFTVSTTWPSTVYPMAAFGPALRVGPSPSTRRALNGPRLIGPSAQFSLKLQRAAECSFLQL
eukprot:10145162-Alexandrium_andersonii.AAC.1